MEMDIKEVATTLVIGAYLIFGIEVILYSFFGTNIIGRVSDGKVFSTYGFFAFALTICFALGMVMEDMSDKYVDEDTYLSQGIAMLRIFASDDEIKTKVLFGEAGERKPRPIAVELAEREVFRKYGGSAGALLDPAVVAQNVATVSDADLASASKAVYYHAKNVVYRHSTYYDEMSRMQQRIDFSRAFVLTSAILLAVIILAAIVKFTFVDLGQLRSSWMPGAMRDRFRPRSRYRVLFRAVILASNSCLGPFWSATLWFTSPSPCSRSLASCS